MPPNGYLNNFWPGLSWPGYYWPVYGAVPVVFQEQLYFKTTLTKSENFSTTLLKTANFKTTLTKSKTFDTPL